MVSLELCLGIGRAVEEWVVGGWVGFGGAGWVTEGELFKEWCPVSSKEEGHTPADGFGKGLGFREWGKDETVIEQEGVPERGVGRVCHDEFCNVVKAAAVEGCDFSWDFLGGDTKASFEGFKG
jgi:hypothetical protein